MNRTLNAGKLMRLSMVAASILTLMGIGSIAKGDAIRVEITRPGQQTLTLGEPIVLHYIIANDSAQQMNVEMGLDGAIGGTKWIAKSLTAANGKSIPIRDDPHHTDAGGLHFNSVLIGPNEQREGDLVASQWFSIPSPGEYTLGIQVHLAYGTGQSVDSSIENSLASPATFAQEYRFPVTITASDLSRLQTLAASLEHAATHAKDPHQAAILIQELVSMPEAQAWASWMELSKNPALQSTLASELARFPTTKTADLLSQMAWPATASPSQTGSSQAYERLSEMYNHSTGKLKDHIKQLYGEHGIALPERILALQNG